MTEQHNPGMHPGYLETKPSPALCEILLSTEFAPCWPIPAYSDTDVLHTTLLFLDLSPISGAEPIATLFQAGNDRAIVTACRAYCRWTFVGEAFTLPLA